MAQIPFTLRELKNAWVNLHAASQQRPRDNAHRLLLVYAVECGLKAMWLKQENRTLFVAEDVARTGHELNDVIKQLRLRAVFPTVFHLSDVKDERRNPIARRPYRMDTLHQAWRYGGELVSPPVDDAAVEVALEQINRLIEKGLAS